MLKLDPALIPTTGQAGPWRLRWLVPADSARDHQAWLGALPRIQQVFGPGNGWPDPGMTLAENTEDLVRHLEESRTGRTAAWTVWLPEGEAPSGAAVAQPLRAWRDEPGAQEQAAPESWRYAACLYLKPFKSRLEDDARRGRFHSLCYVWTAEDFAAHDALIHQVSEAWLAAHVPRQGVAWPGRDIPWDQWQAMARG